MVSVLALTIELISKSRQRLDILVVVPEASLVAADPSCPGACGGTRASVPT